MSETIGIWHKSLAALVLLQATARTLESMDATSDPTALNVGVEEVAETDALDSGGAIDEGI